MIGFANSLHAEVKSLGIQVNTLIPGLVKGTKMADTGITASKIYLLINVVSEEKIEYFKEIEKGALKCPQVTCDIFFE